MLNQTFCGVLIGVPFKTLPTMYNQEMLLGGVGACLASRDQIESEHEVIEAANN